MKIHNLFSTKLFLSSVIGTGVLASSLLASRGASAMPFNTDMFEVQPSTDAVARKKPAGSISIGSIERQKPDDKTAWVQKNPYSMGSPGSLASSVARGERKFQTNCSPCHGGFKDGVHVPSAIMAKGMPSIDLSSEAVRYNDPGTNQNPKPDSHFFNYVFNGGVLMPAYGYKLSNNDVWDLISYVRYVQSKGAELQAKK